MTRCRAALRGPSPKAMDAAEAIRLRSESSSVRIALTPRPGGAPGTADRLAPHSRYRASLSAAVTSSALNGQSTSTPESSIASTGMRAP
jgi:hypothetical protein